MNINDVLILYDYNYWANRRIMAACARLDGDKFSAPAGLDGSSLRGTLVHVMDGESAWRTLYQENTLAGFGALREEDFPTPEALHTRWKYEERKMRDYLARLRTDDLENLVRYTTEEGDKRERVLWHCLAHVVNHGTQHRSEAAVILTGFGCSPGGMDMTLFLNERGKNG